MVSRTELVDLHGKVKYIHAVTFNKYNKWSVTIHPDAKSLEVIHALKGEGLKNMVKKDDDGYFIQFSREPTKLMRGKVVAFAAPKVVGPDGQPLDGTKIGWGSDATIRLEVYSHGTPSGGTAKAARWEGIRVNNLIPFNADRDLGADESAAIKALNAAPKPVYEGWD